MRQHGNQRLKVTRQPCLFREDNLAQHQFARFGDSRNRNLKTACAWAMKECFQTFWDSDYAGVVWRIFRDWYNWASPSRPRAIVRAAKMNRQSFANMITPIRYPRTKAMAEGFNSKIQAVKSSAHNFRSFVNYRLRIRFYRERPDVLPDCKSQ